MRATESGSYDYELPKELIASQPAQPADSSKLLVYDRKSGRISHHIFKELPSLIPQNTHIFFNDTKVIKARLFGRKSSGGKVELLINRPLESGLFNVFIKGRVKPLTKISFGLGLEAEVVKLLDDGSREVRFFYQEKVLDFTSLLPFLERIGHVPLPPYIDRADTKSDESSYQPLFAKKAGAVAAPTASLHFTPALLKEIKRDFNTSFITLHVGAGTFKPVEVEDITKHKMHSEYFEIPKKSAKIIDSDTKILAVGTTVTRTIEYYVRTKKLHGECDLFLNPINPPKRVDYLLTNFHLPKSTLIMLVASFIGIEKTMEIYKTAVNNRYRFYSYGDAMLIL